jgi:AcrR family transcriptional regulator
MPAAAAPTPHKNLGGRPTREASAALADLILDTAWRLFVEHGYKQLKVDQIAKDAAVSKRTIYDRFESKEVMFEALVTRASARWAAQTSAVYEASSRGDWLSPFVRHLLELMGSKDFRALTSFITTEGHDFPEAVKARFAVGDESLAGLANYFEARIEKYPAGKDGILLARTVLVHIGGWATLFPDAQPRVAEPQIRDRVAREVRALLDLYGCGALRAAPRK